jgi:hypothetical protein
MNSVLRHFIAFTATLPKLPDSVGMKYFRLHVKPIMHRFSPLTDDCFRKQFIGDDGSLTLTRLTLSVSACCGQCPPKKMLY